MKKILSIVLIMTLLLSGLFILTGCDNDKNEKGDTSILDENFDYSKATAQDLLNKIKDINNVSTDEYIWLVSTYSNVKIKDDFSLEENITDEALKQIESKAKPSIDSYVGTLLDSDFAQVRGYGISLITTLTGVSEKNIERAKKLIKDEKDEYVIFKAVKALSNSAAKDKEIADFLIANSEHENAKIRTQVAYALGNSWSKGVDGAVDTIIKLMNDKDMSVRKAACSSSGKLADEKVIDPLVEILKNADEADLHSSCIDGLNHLWYDFPFFENTSEKAYNATMDYLKTTPRTDKIPSWSAVGSFRTTSTQDSFKEWKEKATYFNVDDIYNIMVDIIKDENANYLARTSAIDVIKSHCSEEKFAELKTVVEGLTDSKATSVKSAYDNKAK